MADSKKTVIVEVDLKDYASSKIKQIGKGINDFGSGVSKYLKPVAAAFAAVTAAVIGTGVALQKMSIREGQIEGLSKGFVRSFGNMEKSLGTLRKASSGMVSDFDLMQTANRAALLGVTNDVDKLSQLMITARLRGREMGLDMTTAFNDIVTGIGRGSPLILDNLGIKIPDAIKKSMEKMGEAEKTQALLNFAIKDGIQISKEYGNVQLTAAEKAAILAAQWQNAKDAFSKAVSPLGELISMGLTPVVERLQKAGDALGKFIESLGIDFEERVNAAKGFMEAWWKDNKENFEPGISRIVEKLAGKDGLAEGIKAIFFPTDEAKKRLSALMTESVQKLIDGIGGDGGLIDKLVGLSTKFQEISWNEVEKGFKTITDAAKIFIKALEKIVETYTGYSWIFGGYKIPERININPKTQAAFEAAQKEEQRKKLGLPVHSTSGTGEMSSIDPASRYGLRATGGVGRGGMTLVGEAGPELVNLPRGSHVYNNKDSQQMVGGGGITINIQAPVYGVDNLKASIMEAVNQATEKQNRLANYNLL